MNFKREMHTYVARAWYRDAQTLTLIATFVFFAVQDREVLAMIPATWHPLIDKGIVLVLLFQRFKSATRPVGLTQGATREVYSIPPKP